MQGESSQLWKKPLAPSATAFNALLLYGGREENYTTISMRGIGRVEKVPNVRGTKVIGVGWVVGSPHPRLEAAGSGGWGVGQRQWEQRVSPLLVSIGRDGCRGMRKQLGGLWHSTECVQSPVRVPLTTLSTTSVGRSESVSNSPSGGSQMDGETQVTRWMGMSMTMAVAMGG